MNKPFATHPLRAAQPPVAATVICLTDYRQRKMTQTIEGLNQWLVTGDHAGTNEPQA